MVKPRRRERQSFFTLSHSFFFPLFLFLFLLYNCSFKLRSGITFTCLFLFPLSLHLDYHLETCLKNISEVIFFFLRKFPLSLFCLKFFHSFSIISIVVCSTAAIREKIIYLSVINFTSKIILLLSTFFFLFLLLSLSLFSSSP